MKLVALTAKTFKTNILHAQKVCAFFKLKIILCLTVNMLGVTPKFISDVNECLRGSTTCQNGGTCHNTDGGYECTCTPAWIGDSCETGIFYVPINKVLLGFFEWLKRESMLTVPFSKLLFHNMRTLPIFCWFVVVYSNELRVNTYH